MAGGVGSRFWPLSTPEYPKQFIDILGCGRTLIQLTVDRFKGIAPMSNFWVVTNAAYVDIVKQQIPDMPASHILAEPAARNTAPCIAWACWSIKKEDPAANVVVTPADAVVMNPGGYAHTSIALADCIRAIGIPVVEVHISDISKREPYRHHSYTGEACVKRFMGLGMEGYAKAIESLD